MTPEEKIWALDNEGLLSLIVAKLCELNPTLRVGQQMVAPLDVIDGNTLMAKTYRVLVRDLVNGTFNFPARCTLYPYTANRLDGPFRHIGDTYEGFSSDFTATQLIPITSQEQADMFNVIFFRCAIL